MKLQDGCRYIWSDRSVERFVKGICFGLSCRDQKDFFSRHDVLDSHGIRLLRHIIHAFKKSCVCLDGALCKIHTVSFLFKSRSRLIEADMPVSADSQQLHVDTAYAADDFIIIRAGFFTVFFQAVWYVGFCFIDVYVIKQIGVHEIAIALIIFSGKSFILIKVYGCDLRKIQISFFVPLDQLFVHSNRCGTCSQTKNRSWLHDDLGRHDICCFSAYVVIIFSCINNHNLSPSPYGKKEQPDN